VSTAGLAARRAALGLLHDVLHEGRMLDEGGLAAGLEGPEKARARALAEAALRNLGRIDAILGPWMERVPPLRVRNALRLAAAELLALGTPAHAAVDAAVELVAAAPKSRHLRGFANAVARRLAREGPALWAAQDAPALALSAPVRARLADSWGAEAARAIASAHLSPPPLDLTAREPAAAGRLAAALGALLTPTGSIRLVRPGQISALPGYAEGEWWVQDAAAAIPARLLGPVRGRRVLDLCAAPGGKTLQIAAAGATVTALDISAARLARLRENLARTGLSAGIVEADAFGWRPDAPFDAILLDAPCSATGTMRRHPDLAHRPEGFDLRGLTRLQDGLLSRAWSWLAPGGRLVYATCSLLPAEGEARIARFLHRHPEAAALPLPKLPGLPAAAAAGEGMLRLRPDFWPEIGGMDGFFVALIERRA
jgi:16S rRNA (cytosine967-C5)-methyltransferase